MESCGNFVEMVEKDESVLSKIVTGDEIWCFMYDPTTKSQSAEWVSPDKTETEQGPHGKITCENNVHRLLQCSRCDSP
jgi:hypothetical protein